jgi:hypothetical protein
VRIDDFGDTLDVLHLAELDQLSGAARQPLDDRVLEVAQLFEIDPRFTELDAPRLRVPRFVNQVGDVQQCLGRNASATRRRPPGLTSGSTSATEPQVRAQKRRALAAGRPNNNELQRS